MTPSHRRAGWLALALLGACREGSEQAGTFAPVFPGLAGTQGCGPLTPLPGTFTPVFTSTAIGPLSQLAAVAGTETVYFTGDDGSVHELVFPLGGGAPSDTVLLAPGVIEAAILLPAGIADPARLSGIAVLDDQFLVVAEHASNSLLAVRRDVPDTVQNLAGLPLAAGGFADGLAGNIRFHFGEPAPLFADARGLVFVGDSENHALRMVELGGLPVATTVVGTGAPGAGEGVFAQTQFDGLSGMASSCPGELLVVESGSAGAGGHRLLSLAIGEPSPFGGFDGVALALAGDGTNETVQGVDVAAHLGTPQGLAATQDGLVFWVDAKEGILRRYDFVTGTTDCPTFADCTAAVGAGGSFAGAHFSVALGASGALYVLEADDLAAPDLDTLYRVDP